MAKWRCTVCNYVYDEEKEGKPFGELPPTWICPVCGAPKSAFTLLEGVEAPEEVPYNVGDKIVAQLVALGVRHVFGIPGDSILPLVDALRKREGEISFTLTRHEETAAFMASAYAKLTDELGVCLSIAGPGATNLITGLVDASTDRAPVLALAGQVSQVFLGSESLQEIDEIEIFAPFTFFHEAVASPSQAINLTMHAVKKAYHNRGAAMMSLPTDVLTLGLRDEVWVPEEHLFRCLPDPSEEEIDRAVEFIDESRRPFILGGWEMRHCGGEVVRLADRISAPIATTTRAKGVVPETHGLAVGVLGSLGTRYAARAIREADLVVVLGSGFRQRNLVPDLPIIQVDIDPVKVGKSFPVKVGVCGDAKKAVEMLLGRVSPKEPDEEYFGAINKLREEHRREIEGYASDRSVPIHPGFLIQAMKRHADRDAIITVDSGDHTYWFYRYYTCDGERTLLSANMASMAFAFPAALAAKVAYPDRQAIAVNGDGGFGMLMADFTTAVRDGLAVKVVVFNDGKIKNIEKEQRMYGYPPFGTALTNPDFAGYARSCGGEGYRAETPDELETALEEAFASEKPSLIDAVVDPEKTAPITRAP